MVILLTFRFCHFPIICLSLWYSTPNQRGRGSRDRMDLKLPITTKVASPFRRVVLDIPLCDKAYQLFAQVGGFPRVLMFPPLIKLTATMPRYSWNTVESGVKQHNLNPKN
jgi:hypothetical protein